MLVCVLITVAFKVAGPGSNVQPHPLFPCFTLVPVMNVAPCYHEGSGGIGWSIQRQWECRMAGRDDASRNRRCSRLRDSFWDIFLGGLARWLWKDWGCQRWGGQSWAYGVFMCVMRWQRTRIYYQGVNGLTGGGVWAGNWQGLRT